MPEYQGVSQKAQDSARQAAIDRFGEADRLMKLWRAPVNPHQQERAQALAALETLYESHPAEETDVAQGESYQLEVSARHHQRELTDEAKQNAFYKLQRLRTIVKGKIERFNVFSVFSVTLEAIEKHLGEPYLDSIAPKKRTGRRTYKAVAKAAAEAA